LYKSGTHVKNKSKFLVLKNEKNVDIKNLTSNCINQYKPLWIRRYESLVEWRNVSSFIHFPCGLPSNLVPIWPSEFRNLSRYGINENSCFKITFFYSVTLIIFLPKIAYHSVYFFHLFWKTTSQTWEALTCSFMLLLNTYF
jgi:hypothetical protein